jgi:hypothetical protein
VAGGYWLVSFTAMLAFGYENWSRRGEFLSIFFGMISRFGIFQIMGPATLEAAASGRTPTPCHSPQVGGELAHSARDRQRTSLSGRRGSSPPPCGEGPGAGVEERAEGLEAAELRLMLPAARLPTAAALAPSRTLFLLLALASVSFDGLSRTFFWLGANGVNPLEFPGRSALTTINGGGLVLTFATLAAAYFAAIAAGRWLAGKRQGLGMSAGLMVWSIVPIALAYHFSHYLTALAVNGQYALVALSDPFSRGWDLFGTAGLHVDVGIVMGADSAWLIWNLQAFAIVAGHMIAVLVAHRLAFRLHGTNRAAVLSQLPLAVLMIAYTVFGLWLLSTPAIG